ncbi:MAG: translation elongation factor Ts [Sphingomonadaceae bacterium]|uniref:translation elongation factor Ts n=1 Tax=Thermaurantiacus sp. TaxID=2820283 RepID=UPI00298EFB70|nr:translation elongation factor Ts [Thermaurantiacus sp.]MCS6986538.1 translation elongation factor Ts [Sphingomonadaceae bacterium]MDW8414201.1 translation elongation factor Ts [Thermaurantiacus sp.]
MAEITAQLVKDLRERTGAGMMDCKRALTETDGDMEKAIDWLRAKGLAAAAKKAGRTAAEGLVGVAVAGRRGAAVEVNAETDFVAKNDRFQALVRGILTVALEHGADVERLLEASMPGGPGTVREAIATSIATIGENQTLRRAAVLEVGEGLVVPYVHNAVADGLGRIGVLVALEGDAPEPILAELGKQLALHVAWAGPLALTPEEMDPALVARERAVAEAKAAESGKPADIVARMVEGAVRKFTTEHALLTQGFLGDAKTKVADVVARAAREAGARIRIAGFVRLQLGEGIARPESDFAAEVAAAVAGQA